MSRIPKNVDELISAAIALLREPYPSTEDKKPVWDCIVNITKDKRPRCFRCGSPEEVTFGTDPYAVEINDDHTEVWQCRGCACESAGDI